jgi:hypothetical protein
MHSPLDGNDSRLDALLRAYRDACPVPEPGPNFMPELWQRIEARRSVTYAWRRWAGAFVTVALAFSFAIGIYTLVPGNTTNPAYYSQSYVEALAAAHDVDLEPGLEASDSSQVY